MYLLTYVIVYVKWKRGYKKQNSGKTRAVVCRDRSAIWENDEGGEGDMDHSVMLMSTLYIDRVTKGFESKKVTFSLKCDDTKESAQLGKTFATGTHDQC